MLCVGAREKLCGIPGLQHTTRTCSWGAHIHITAEPQIGRAALAPPTSPTDNRCSSRSKTGFLLNALLSALVQITAQEHRPNPVPR